MKIRIELKPDAKSALARYRKDDPGGIDQVIDAINTLHRNPDQAKKWGKAFRRMHVGIYRILFEIIDGDPIVVEVQQIGR